MEPMPIESFDILGPAKVGHRPIVGSINLAWRPSSGSALQRITYQSRGNCRAAQQDDARWSAFLSTNLALLTEAKWTDIHDIKHTQDFLTRNFCAHFASSSRASAPMWQSTQGLMSRKWELLASIRRFTTPSLSNCFSVWKLVVAHHKCDALQKRCSRRARTERFDRMVDEACTAASRHDQTLQLILGPSRSLGHYHSWPHYDCRQKQCPTCQFAYFPGRGTFEAISRAAAHCRYVTPCFVFVGRTRSGQTKMLFLMFLEVLLSVST